MNILIIVSINIITALCASDHIPSCLDLLRRSYNPRDSLWTETHCHQTAHSIIALCNERGLLKTGSEYGAGDLPDFCTSPMGQRLLMPRRAEDHDLFVINICGGAHVCVVEKAPDTHKSRWTVFQSWHHEFSLAEWLACQSWNNKKFEQDFLTYGMGQAYRP